MRWLSFYGDALTYKLGTKELSMTEPRWAWAREALSGKPNTIMHLTRTTQKIALPAAAASLRYEKSSAGGRSGDAFERPSPLHAASDREKPPGQRPTEGQADGLVVH
jgi:hypothetical protein